MLFFQVVINLLTVQYLSNPREKEEGLKNIFYPKHGPQKKPFG
jgi:hypothetical protein